MKISTQTDKAFCILTILCFIFWVLAKIPASFDFIPFDIIYQASWMGVALLTVICTFYFLYKWGKSKFVFTKMYIYNALLGIITLLIMRFIY